MKVSKLRVGIAASLFSISFVCFVRAYPTGGSLTSAQKAGYKKCVDAYESCQDNCSLFSPGTMKQACTARCDSAWQECLRKYHILMPTGPGGPIQQVSPPPKEAKPNPTPRKGPGQTIPPGKSHPTATPRKGPGQISGLPKGSPTPQPSATAPPVLLKKSGSPTPTPH